MATVSDFTRGLWKEHPIFVLVLGMCPALAVTTSAINGIGMGLATTFVLVCSNIVVSSIRNVIPSKVRIPSFIVIIASFVTIVDLVMNGYLHDLHKTLGLFIPLIVVNCLILGRSEAFASRKPILDSLIDGLGMGVGFTLGLFILGAIREVLGNGSILGLSIFGEGYQPLLVMVLPPGAFITLGFLLGLMNVIEEKRQQRTETH